MRRPILRAGVVSRTDIKAVNPVVQRVINALQNNSVKVILETETAMALESNAESMDLTDLDGDFIVSIGGDGTLLRTAMGIKVSETPLLGVNMGRRGFLCEVLKEDVEQAIARVTKGDYILERCSKLRSRCLDMAEDFPDALNEVLVASSLPSKMLLFKLYVDEEQLTEIQADGVIIATPTGSTAYNLSAGGSVLAPGVNAMILTAINPYSYFRSITLPLNAKVRIELLKPKADALAIIDGKIYTALKPMSSVEIAISNNTTRFIRFKPFYSRLRGRLSHLQAQ